MTKERFMELLKRIEKGDFEAEREFVKERGKFGDHYLDIVKWWLSQENKEGLELHIWGIDLTCETVDKLYLIAGRD